VVANMAVPSGAGRISEPPLRLFIATEPVGTRDSNSPNEEPVRSRFHDRRSKDPVLTRTGAIPEFP